MFELLLFFGGLYLGAYLLGKAGVTMPPLEDEDENKLPANWRFLSFTDAALSKDELVKMGNTEYNGAFKEKR